MGQIVNYFIPLFNSAVKIVKLQLIPLQIHHNLSHQLYVHPQVSVLCYVAYVDHRIVGCLVAINNISPVYFLVLAKLLV